MEPLGPGRQPAGGWWMRPLWLWYPRFSEIYRHPSLRVRVCGLHSVFGCAQTRPNVVEQACPRGFVYDRRVW